MRPWSRALTLRHIAAAAATVGIGTQLVSHTEPLTPASDADSILSSDTTSPPAATGQKGSAPSATVGLSQLRQGHPGGCTGVAAQSGGAPRRPVVICGPSGVGKGTLIARLMAEFPDLCGFSVSHTTRQPRPGEVDGVHYNFASRAQMEADIAAGKFLEKADVHGNLYGTSVAAVTKVTDSGKMCILDIDVQGARQVKQNPQVSAIYIFISPPSFEELERRLRGRGTETEQQVQKRLRNARAEMESSREPGLFDYVIVNDDLEAAYAQLKRILGLTSTQAPAA